MNILQVSTSDIAGGAERVAWTLFSAYRQRGHGSWLVVGVRRSDDPDVLALPTRRETWPWTHLSWVAHGRLAPLEGHLPGVGSLRSALRMLAHGPHAVEREKGREDFAFPASRKLLSMVSQPVDIIHGHNLHGGYFDLRYLAQLSHSVPVVLTLHDEWMLTGHCACTLGCPRWEHGCGNCPDLTVYPAVMKDATAYNWKRKRSIYARSRLYVATPSRWLMDRVQRSMLKPVETRVIHNGVDLAVYHPADRRQVRAQLGLPQNVVILLFAAQGGKNNRFKDYETIEQAISRLQFAPDDARRYLFMSLGGSENTETVTGQVRVKSVPFQKDQATVARYYQAADLFLHAARADNFPNTVLEAQACGTPVIATAVGGIPEQIEDGVTGFLTPPSDAGAMAERVMHLMADDGLRQRMGLAAAESALRRFDLEQQVDAYLGWYHEIVDRERFRVTEDGLVSQFANSHLPHGGDH